ncbi:MAG: hypothetical protein AAF743_06750, partial [Planctomycetota bacterium]
MRGFTILTATLGLLAGTLLAAPAYAITVTTPATTITFVEGTPSVDVPLFATGGDTFNALNFAAVLGDGGPPLAGTTDPADPTFITDALVLDGSLFETPTVDLAANGLVRVLALDPAAPLPGELLAAQVAADAAPGETPTNVDG